MLAITASHESYVDRFRSDDTGTGAAIGRGTGVVVGWFAPPLLAATAVGVGIGALVGHLAKKHEEKEMGVEIVRRDQRDDRRLLILVPDLAPQAFRCPRARDGHHHRT